MALNCKGEQNVDVMFSIRDPGRFGCRFFNLVKAKGYFESKGPLRAYLRVARGMPRPGHQPRGACAARGSGAGSRQGHRLLLFRGPGISHPCMGQS